MRILCLDPAGKIGWAWWNLNDTPSGIRLGALKLTGKTAFEKVRSIRELLPPLIKEVQPDYVAFESPLQFIPSYDKKSTDLFDEESGEKTMSPKSTLILNRISGAVQVVVEGFRIPCEEVYPQSWQAIIDKRIPKGTKEKQVDVKERVRMHCDLHRIIGGNQDAKDAAVMCMWARARSQLLKQLIHGTIQKELAL